MNKNLARQSRYNSLLDILFLLAAALYILLMNSLVGMLLYACSLSKTIFWHPYSIDVITVLALIIFGGILVMRIQLLGGGKAFATRIGARQVDTLHEVPEERRLVQLTQAMAARLSIKNNPAIYILDDDIGANAFIVGHRHDDMALVVTWGLLQILDQQELQGVIAQLLSRMVSGDIRFNFRMLILFGGLLSIAQLGSYVGRIGVAPFKQQLQKDRRRGVVFVLIGSVIWLLGSGGVMAVRLIKYLMLHQRTFLADMQSLRLTKNQGLLQALLRLRAYELGSALHGVYVESVNHFCFANAMAQGSLFVTQPTLDARIYAISPAAYRRAKVQERVLLEQHLHVDWAKIEEEESDESGLILGKPNHTPHHWQPPQPFPSLRMHPATTYARDAVRPLTFEVRELTPRPDIIKRALGTATGCREILVAVLSLRQHVACSLEQQHISRAILESLSGLDQRLYVSIFLQAAAKMGHMPVSSAKNLLTRLAVIMQADGHVGLLDVLLLERVRAQLKQLPQAVPVTLDQCVNAVVSLLEALLHVTEVSSQRAVRIRARILRTVLSPEQLLNIHAEPIQETPVNMGQVLYQLAGLLQRDKMHLLAVIEACLWEDTIMTQEEQDVLDLLYWRLGLESQQQQVRDRSKMALEI